MDGVSGTTCCKSISGLSVTARSAATANLAALSHPTPAMRCECPLLEQMIRDSADFILPGSTRAFINAVMST